MKKTLFILAINGLSTLLAFLSTKEIIRLYGIDFYSVFAFIQFGVAVFSFVDFGIHKAILANLSENDGLNKSNIKLINRTVTCVSVVPAIIFLVMAIGFYSQHVSYFSSAMSPTIFFATCTLAVIHLYQTFVYRAVIELKGSHVLSNLHRAVGLNVSFAIPLLTYNLLESDESSILLATLARIIIFYIFEYSYYIYKIDPGIPQAKIECSGKYLSSDFILRLRSFGINSVVMPTMNFIDRLIASYALPIQASGNYALIHDISSRFSIVTYANQQRLQERVFNGPKWRDILRYYAMQIVLYGSLIMFTFVFSEKFIGFLNPNADNSAPSALIILCISGLISSLAIPMSLMLYKQKKSLLLNCISCLDILVFGSLFMMMNDSIVTISKIVFARSVYILFIHIIASVYLAKKQGSFIYKELM